MKELIKIATNEKGVQCVSARELHEGLKVQQDFSDWIKKQLDNQILRRDKRLSK